MAGDRRAGERAGCGHSGGERRHLDAPEKLLVDAGAEAHKVDSQVGPRVGPAGAHNGGNKTAEGAELLHTGMHDLSPDCAVFRILLLFIYLSPFLLGAGSSEVVHSAAKAHRLPTPYMVGVAQLGTD